MNNKLKGCFQHKSDHWKTPSKLYEILIEKKYKDPCPFMSKKDGMKKNYFREKIYINPPYSKIKEWVEYGINQYFKNYCEVLFLIPARTDTKYFQELMSYSPDIYFIKGRLHFNDSKTGAPFPSILVRLRHQNPRINEMYNMDLDKLIYCIKIDKF